MAEGLKTIANHPWRERLLGEAHARPSLNLAAPVDVMRFALLAPPGEDRADYRHFLDTLCERAGVPTAPEGAFQHGFQSGGLHVVWERHTEFVTYTFSRQREGGQPLAAVGPDEIAPPAWISGMPGELFAAGRVTLAPSAGDEADFESAREIFAEADLASSQVGGGEVTVMSDFRPDRDGFVRYVCFDRTPGARPDHRGRTIQRLLEIETYRLAALLGYALARETRAELSGLQREVSVLMDRLVAMPHTGRDRDLLIRLSRIAGRSEALLARTSYRYSATRAYYRIVLERIERLREERIPNRQRFSVFMDLRLAPAMRTCDAAAAQHEELGEQISRVSQLLATRVNVAVEDQNAQLLRSMDRRAKMQLRLQETVEGLSTVAITYYLVGLIYYVARAFTGMGLPIDPIITAGLSTPLAAAAVWLGVRGVRRRLSDNSDEPPASA